MDGITAAQWLSAGSNVLGKALTPSPAGPSNASAYLDGGGWSVNIGSGSASASSATNSQWPMLLAILAAGVVLVYRKG